MKRKKEKKKRVFEHLISGVMWLIIFTFIGVLFTSMFDFIIVINNRAFLQFALPLTAIFIMFITTLSYGWGLYNKKRFGTLNRRSMPDEVTLEDLEERTDERRGTLTQLQTQEWVEIG
ncbi:hypothetical protein LCL96_18175 [Rossellomorea aquimaris]|uniref:hypothetical protein n=1 Tax=Rossellomorea aquimaris TaxID=189382 RepID=UPI001CD4DFF4|nr:hypothetical protein [Rossellomorea aquimaris]MCA1060845.1 hypothetical protein [Rossellomorea aquimaris]